MAKRFRQNTLDVFLKKKPKLKDQEDGYENKEESNREEDRDQETEESNREEDRDQNKMEESNSEKDRDQETEESNREDDRDQETEESNREEDRDQETEESNREEDRDQNKMEESNSEKDRDQETEESNREDDRDQETEESNREEDRDQNKMEESNSEKDRDQETEESNREDDRDQETEESNREEDRDQNKMEESNSEKDRDQETEESNREDDRDQNKMEESNSEKDRDQETEESNREDDRDQNKMEESNREEDRDQETEESNREDDRDQNKMEESNREEDRDQNKMEESNSENDRDQETEESNREEDRDQETEEEDREQRNLDEDDISDEQGSENTDEGTLHPFDPVRMKKKINKGESLSDGDKTCLLQNRWIPPEQHSYPYRKFGAKQLKYNVQWEKKYEWLRYSPFEDSAYCAHCLSFNKLKGSNFSFLTKGFIDWKNAVGEKRGIIPRHSLTEGHRKSTEKAENFLSVVQKKRKDISSIISQKYEEKVIANRNSLLSIIDIIVCLGQRNVAFRGSWEGDSENGNFNHFVNWKAQFDVALKQHMQTAPKNAIYLSPAIQNELIECCAEEIRGTLINRIQAAQYFTVLADESMDISGTEQMSLCVRYVNEEEENLEIKEDFLGFCPLPKQDAATITSAILNQLTKWGLHTTFLRGQGYDGASTMSGKVSGVQKRVKELYPRAMYTHCRSHALNLVVVHGCSDLPLVRNTMSIVEKIAVFFSATGARKDALRAESRREGQPKTAGIPLMSDTRWGSRANTLSTFVEQFTAIHSVLETMEAEVTTTSGKASTLRHSIGTFETIITAVIANKVLGYMLPLTKKLQSTNLDIITAYEEARNVRQVIAKQRNEQGFSPCFQKATALANSVDVVPTKRRITVKQNYRANISTESVEDHYRVNLFYPFIDHITSELDERFSESNEPALLAAYLVPKSLKKLTEEREQRMVKWYHEDLPYPNTVEQEIECWRHKFHSEDGVLPASALETLKTTQMSFFPNIQCMLKIFLTLPVTTCECERSFSAMRRLKTWLRSSMSSERLTGLALMHVHQKVKLDKERVLRRWDASGHRRIQLAFNGKVMHVVKSIVIQQSFAFALIINSLSEVWICLFLFCHFSEPRNEE